jgi:sec-independent protein translocase protein TatA
MNAIFLLGMPGGSEMLIVFLVVLLLFGGTRLPKLAKGLGESIKEFKKGTSGEDDDEIAEASRRRMSLRDAQANGFRTGEIARDRYAVSERR